MIKQLKDYEPMMLTDGFYVRTGNYAICFINTYREKPQAEIESFAKTTLKDAVGNYMPVSKEIVNRFIEQNKPITKNIMETIKNEKLTYFIFGYKSLVATNAYYE